MNYYRTTCRHNTQKHSCTNIECFFLFSSASNKCSMSIAHERLTTICIDLELFMQFSWFFHRQPLLSLPLPQICTWNKTDSLMSSLWEEKNIKNLRRHRKCARMHSTFCRFPFNIQNSTCYMRKFTRLHEVSPRFILRWMHHLLMPLIKLL